MIKSWLLKYKRLGVAASHRPHVGCLMPTLKRTDNCASAMSKPKLSKHLFISGFSSDLGARLPTNLRDVSGQSMPHVNRFAQLEHKEAMKYVAGLGPRLGAAKPRRMMS